MLFVFFFFNDTATTEIYTLSLHDALPICNIDRAAAGDSSDAAGLRAFHGFEYNHRAAGRRMAGETPSQTQIERSFFYTFHPGHGQPAVYQSTGTEIRPRDRARD